MDIMSRISHLPLASGLLALWMLTCGLAAPGPAQEPAPAKNVLFAKSLNALIRSVTETVLASHIEPPTRQQMVLDVIRYIAIATDRTVSPELAAAISNAKDAEGIYQLLAFELTNLGVTETESTVDLKVIEAAYHSCLYYGFHFVSESNARAEEQLASNRYVGIGVQLKQLPEGEGQSFIGVIADGPAVEAGVLTNDILESVEDKSTISMSLEDVITMLRGPESTTVTVTVRTVGQPARKLKLVRRVVPLKSAYLTGQDRQNSALLIKFDSITASSLNELQKLVAQFEEDGSTTKTIVLDLRNTKVSDIHYLHLFADGILDELSFGQVQSRQGMRILKTEDGKLFGARKIVFLVSPIMSEKVNLLALAAIEAGLKVVSFPSRVVEAPIEEPPPLMPWLIPIAPLGVRPNDFSLNTIPVAGTEHFIQIATNRLLTNKGKKIDAKAVSVILPKRNLPKLNGALQYGTSDLNVVLRNLED